MLYKTTGYIAVFIAAASYKQAKKIGFALVSQRLVACINIVRGIDSVFRWRGKLDNAKEVILICKTKASCFSKIVKIVKKNHSYEVPEIISLPIIAGNKDYLKWIDESVG